MDQEIVFALCSCLALIRIVLDNNELRFMLIYLATFAICATAVFETGKALMDLIDLGKMGLVAFWARAVEHYAPPLLGPCIGTVLVPTDGRLLRRPPQ